jgi:hypothetical protein
MEPKTTFTDGLGERRHTTGTGNQPLDVLILHEELTAVPAFEVAVRERVDQLSTFQHPSYARIRGVGRLAKAPSRLAIASDHVRGVRLSEVLAVAEQRLIPLEITAAFFLLHQIVPAVAALHEKAPDAAHGAIGPERIVVSPDGQVTLVEHVLGGALEQLRFSHERYWKELRIPLPLAGGLPRFDRRADVTQLGALALALVLGRALGEDEYPSRIADIVEGVRAVSPSGLEMLPAGVRPWLSGALQLDPRRSFATAIEAQTELDTLPYNGERGKESLRAFLTQCQDAMAVTAASAPASSAVTATPMPVAAPAEPAPVEEPRADSRSMVAPIAERVNAEAPLADVEDDPDREEPVEVPRRLRIPSMRRTWVAAALVLIALASVGTFAGRRYFNAPAVGTLVVETNPAGVEVSVDGERRGATPVTIELPEGKHTLDVPTADGVRSIPVTIAAGGQVAQFIELPKKNPEEGQLQVRTDPPGATVTVDGQRRGVAPLTIGELTPGAHTVVLENTMTSVTESVTIQAGATASLVVPLGAPEGVPVSGWIAVTSPIEVQILENRQLLGSSRSERVMVSAGRHELEIVNDALGFRATRSVQVAPGRVSAIRIEAPQGSMSFNALPWADVWLDGTRLGETPIGNVRVPIGEHDVVFRHPELGEQRHTVVVTLAAPARVTADMRKR